MKKEFYEILEEAKNLDLETLKENVIKLENLISKIEKVLGEEGE